MSPSRKFPAEKAIDSKEVFADVWWGDEGFDALVWADGAPYALPRVDELDTRPRRDPAEPGRYDDGSQS